MIPHVWQLPLRRRLRVYLGGSNAAERYEGARREALLRRALAAYRSALRSGETESDRLRALGDDALGQSERHG